MLRKSWWSYWCHTHDLSAIVGVASSASSSAPEIGAVGEALEKCAGRVGRVERVLVGGSLQRPLVDRTVAEAAARHVGEGFGREAAPLVEQAVEHAEPARVGDLADDRGADLPACAQAEDFVDVFGPDDREHPLLALRRHHLDRVHARLAAVHTRDVDVHPRAGRGGGLRRRAREPGGAQILHADGEAGVEQREARLDEPLLLVRITHLHGRPLGLRALLEAGRREHARAADAVATGGRAEQHRDVAHTLGAGEHEALLRQQAEAEDVDEGIVAIAVVEHDLAADGWHADGVAIAADPRDHSFEEEASPGVL